MLVLDNLSSGSPPYRAVAPVVGYLEVPVTCFDHGADLVVLTIRIVSRLALSCSGYSCEMRTSVLRSSAANVRKAILTSWFSFVQLRSRARGSYLIKRSSRLRLAGIEVGFMLSRSHGNPVR